MLVARHESAQEASLHLGAHDTQEASMHLGGVAVMLRVAVAVVTNKEVLVLATMQSVEQLSKVHDEPITRAHYHEV